MSALKTWMNQQKQIRHSVPTVLEPMPLPAVEEKVQPVSLRQRHTHRHTQTHTDTQTHTHRHIQTRDERDKPFANHCYWLPSVLAWGPLPTHLLLIEHSSKEKKRKERKKERRRAKEKRKKERKRKGSLWL